MLTNHEQVPNQHFGAGFQGTRNGMHPINPPTRGFLYSSIPLQSQTPDSLSFPTEIPPAWAFCGVPEHEELVRGEHFHAVLRSGPGVHGSCV